MGEIFSLDIYLSDSYLRALIRDYAVFGAIISSLSNDMAAIINNYIVLSAIVFLQVSAYSIVAGKCIDTMETRSYLLHEKYAS